MAFHLYGLMPRGMGDGWLVSKHGTTLSCQILVSCFFIKYPPNSYGSFTRILHSRASTLPFFLQLIFYFLHIYLPEIPQWEYLLFVNTTINYSQNMPILFHVTIGYTNWKREFHSATLVKKPCNLARFKYSTILQWHIVFTASISVPMFFFYLV